ncbi:Putative ankyrin repeat protein MM_0045 [Geodia barretti]|uniref:Ankyrin repeat protein MM_0045 n=1 Tax=Geodia barretti TaxID=519541 RepID=A0AA35QYS5_GEOBA|nr:Putative ankyrin repeat protein MM_0045 [Geodia barretti]
MEAAWQGETDVVVELVKGGANLDLQEKNGDSAVISAVVEYKPATLRELVRAGSDLNLQNQEGLTALMIAARSGRTDITNILLEGEHINLDIQENGTGWSALHFSAERGDWDTTQALLEAGASPHLKDKNGLTAMEIAEVKAEEGEEGRPYDEYREERPQYNYEGVISLLREHCQEEPTATTSHHVSIRL